MTEINSKTQIAREMAFQELKKLPEYKFAPIPSSVLENKVNEYLKLSDKELQEKINEYFNGGKEDIGDSLFLQNVNTAQLKSDAEYIRFLGSPNTEKTKQAQQITEFNTNLRSIGVDVNTNILKDTYQDDTIEFMQDMLVDAKQILNTQIKNDNAITGTVNLVKEAFNTEYARSNVQTKLDKTELDISYLKTSTDFAETFKQRRGVEYNPVNIVNAKQEAKKMAKYQASTDMVKTLKAKLSIALTNNAASSGYTAQDAILNTLSAMGYTKIGDVIKTALQKHIDDPNVKNYMAENGNIEIAKNPKTGKYRIRVERNNKDKSFEEITPEMAKIIGEEINLRLNQIYAQSLGLSDIEGKSNKELEELTTNKYNEMKSNYENAFKEAFGEKDLKSLSENYMMSQQKGQAYIQMGVTFLAMAGAMFSGGGSLALVSTGALITNPVDLIARATDEDGMTKQDWKEYGQGVLEQAGWMALGMGAGKVGDMTRSFVKLKGLKAAFKQSGKSFDDFLKLAQGNPDIPQDIARALRKTKMLSESLGVTAEVATDIATTYALQKDGATTTDWVMSITTTLGGTATFKNLISKLKGLKSDPSQAIKEIKNTFLSLELTDADAQKLLQSVQEGEGVNKGILRAAQNDGAEVNTTRHTSQAGVNDKEFRLPTDEEFIQLKDKISHKIQNNGNLKDKFTNIELTKENILIADKILSDKKLYNNINLMNRITDIIEFTDTPEKANTRIQIIDKFLSDEKLYNNENVLYRIGNIIDYTDTPERAEIADKILSDEKLFNNETFMNRITDIINSTDTPEKVKIADKILSEEKLYNNEGVMYWLDNIINSTDTPEKANVRIQIIDKILSDEKLFNNEYVMYWISHIIKSTDTPEQAKITDKILFEKKLYNNENVMKDIGDIINFTDTPEGANARIQIIDKILSDEKLYNNKYVMSRIASIINTTNTPEKVKIADKMLSDEKLYNNGNVMIQIADIIEFTDTQEKANAKIQIIDKILSDEKLFNNKNVMNRIAYIINSTDTPEKANTKIQLIDKFLSDEKLYNNEHVMNRIGNIIKSSDTPEGANARIQIIDKILFDEKLYNNKNVMNWIDNIIISTDTPEKANTRIQIIDKFLSDEKLYNNENVMTWIGNIIDSTDTPEKANARIQIIDKILSDEKLYNNENLMNLIGDIIDSTDETTSIQSIKDMVYVIETAHSKKNQLKSAGEEISDKIIDKFFGNNFGNFFKTVNILGKDVFIHNFTTKLSGLQELGNAISNLKDNLTSQDYHKLLLKINPENTQEYKQLKEEITNLKKTFPQVKQSGDAAALKELQNQIATKTKQAQAILKQKCNLDPQSITDKVRVVGAIAKHNPENAGKFIELINSSTKENEAVWKDEVNKYMFKVVGFEFDKQISDRLNIQDSKYLDKVLISDSDFKEGLTKIMQLLKDNPDKSIAEIFNELPQNIKTKEMLENFGIDYDKYVQNDSNSFVDVTITTSVDAARKSAIESVENDFNDNAFQALPKEETGKIFKALNDGGFETRTVSETVWDANGIPAGTKNVLRLYKDNQPVQFEDMKNVIKIIKQSLNDNDFWTTKSNDATLDSYKETMYTHLMKDRSAQVKNTLELKDDKSVSLRIQKTDMNNIKHALFLGNDGSCCTAAGTGCNQFSAPTYIMNKMISAIEVMDGDNFVGNTMCYFALVDGKPSLILDNIELKSEYHNNDNLKNSFVEYAKKMCQEVGQPDMPIYAGPYRHKLNMEDFNKSEHSMQIIGNTGNDEIYLDFITCGRKVSGNEIDNVTLYKIR